MSPVCGNHGPVGWGTAPALVLRRLPVATAIRQAMECVVNRATNRAMQRGTRWLTTHAPRPANGDPDRAAFRAPRTPRPAGRLRRQPAISARVAIGWARRVGREP